MEVKKEMEMENRNKEPLIIDENLRKIINDKKRYLGSDEVLIKNKLGRDVMQVKFSKWQEIQTHVDAVMWDRLDDKILD